MTPVPLAVWVNNKNNNNNNYNNNKLSQSQSNNNDVISGCPATKTKLNKKNIESEIKTKSKATNYKQKKHHQQQYLHH